MKQAPGASILEWGSAVGKCRTATVQALHRLRDAGLVESDEGSWALVDPQPAAPKPPGPEARGWVEPYGRPRGSPCRRRAGAQERELGNDERLTATPGVAGVHAMVLRTRDF